MGICNSTTKIDNPPPVTLTPRAQIQKAEVIYDSDDERIFHRPNSAHMEEFGNRIGEFQEIHFQRMRSEIRDDPKTFILNNLLMCIQFFDNFERSMLYAKEFKREKEAEMNDNLKNVMHEGVLPGDRRVTLLNGVGEILAKNYIYRPVGQMQADDEYVSLPSIYRNISHNSTFMCEGILPLDFYLSWENFEVHTENEWKKLMHEDYAFAQGDPPIFRCAMEEPNLTDKSNNKSKIPQGYVSLYSEDSPTQRASRALHLPGSKFTDDYSRESDIYHDRVSSYYGSSLASDEDDGESMINMTAGEKLLYRTEKRHHLGRHAIVNSSMEVTSPPISPLTSRKPMADPNSSNASNKLQIHQSEGVIPRNYPKKIALLPLQLPPISEPSIPSIVIQTPSTPTQDLEHSHFQKEKPLNLFFPHPEDVGKKSEHELLRPSSTNKTLKQKREQSRSRSTTPEEHFAPPPLRIPGNQPPPQTRVEYHSSGYESAGTSTMSRSSSTLSEDVRTRWRQLELKQLWQFQAKQSVHFPGHRKSEAVPAECFTEVRVEKDEPLNEEDENAEDDDEDEDDDDSSFNGSLKGRKSQKSSLTDAEDFVTRKYLNSTQVCAYFCCDFQTIATRMGISSTSISQAQVLGTTIRCSVNYDNSRKELAETRSTEDFKLLHTFTPCLHSKQWPQNYLLRFRQRLLLPKNLNGRDPQSKPEEASWLRRIQVEAIDEFGCNLIPLGFRTTQFFNTRQSLEWQTNFCQAESLMLNTFKNVHWRCYIFNAILFRAFISTMGPRGIGLEHIRNLMYHICEEDFISWNDEQPGQHVKAFLNKFYDCLGKRQLPNFFVQSHNMLRNIPPENTLRVQAFLGKIRENLIVYCIFSLRNLTCLRSEEKFYPVADLKKLYRLITAPRERDLLYILNPHLGGHARLPDTNNNNNSPAKGKKGKKPKIIDPNPNIEPAFEFLFGKPQETDVQQAKYRRRYQKWDEKQKRKQKSKEENHQAAIKESIPATERRKSIDLEKLPVNKYTNLRMVMIIDFFIKHFLKMAAKAIQFKAFSEATMYTMHVENLCRLLKGMKLSTTPMGDSQISDYLRQAKKLMTTIGPRASDYVRAKLSHLELHDGTSLLYLNQRLSAASQTHSTENFSFASRKLPTPPASTTKTPKPPKTLKIPEMGLTLQSFSSDSPLFSSNHFEPPLHYEFELSQMDNLSRPRRRTFRNIHEDSILHIPRPVSTRSNSFNMATPGPSRPGHSDYLY